jgi:hypothetical protein
MVFKVKMEITKGRSGLGDGRWMVGGCCCVAAQFSERSGATSSERRGWAGMYLYLHFCLSGTGTGIGTTRTFRLWAQASG